MGSVRPEQEAAIDYLRRKGTEAPAAKLSAGLRSAFRKIEQTLEGVPENVRPRRPAAAAWSVHEIVDHLVATHGSAVAELRSLCAGVPPTGGPIPARLTSPDALARPWAALLGELKSIHADILRVVDDAGDAAPVTAKAPFVMVIKVDGPAGPEVLEWVDAVDWKAYAQALRIHTHEHCVQVERTVAALAPPG